jgi:hypothetical protein
VTPVIVNAFKGDGDAITVIILEEENLKNSNLNPKIDFKFYYDLDRIVPLVELQDQSPIYTYNRSDYIIFLDPVSPPPQMS